MFTCSPAKKKEREEKKREKEKEYRLGKVEAHKFSRKCVLFQIPNDQKYMLHVCDIVCNEKSCIV